MVAVLEVQAPCADLWLSDQHAGLAVDELQEAILFLLIAVGPGDLYGIRDQLFQQVAFFVQVAPHQRRLTGAIDHGGHLLTAVLHGALALDPLLPEVGGRDGEQHALRWRGHVDQVIAFAQLRQDEAAILEAKV
ncbi:MAG: hypothetical protein EBV32_04380 [Proteobacteria bacterium]|uniref:Uncharacterized protein n=1 Tax=Candidatus Fonsibacter lacus TaxID=2576439 RepID=A0A964XQK6_9PROT|nr:hypothetical protein [Candidatus Fonsibacter lacus]